MKHSTILTVVASAMLATSLPSCKEEKTSTPKSAEKQAAPAAESAKKTMDKAAKKGAEKAADAMNKQP
ncbi:MAG: hypothetical protein ACKPEA_14190 [Planctomycetota bacterium]